MDDEDLPEAMFEGERYGWSCTDCGYDEWTETDPRGDTVTCPGCGKRMVVPT